MVRLKKFSSDNSKKPSPSEPKLRRRRLSQKEWLERYLEPLKGAMITTIEIREENGELWPVLRVVKFNEEPRFLEISRDPEGNGPGFIFGLPQVNDPEEVIG